MSRTFLKIIPLILFLILTGVGCIQFSSGPKDADGGVWKTADQGENWGIKKVWLTAAGAQSMGGANIVSLVMDPEDHSAIYAATSDNGLFYTYDGADSWFQAKQLSSGRITSVSVDAKDKCTIYATMGPRVWKSTDCNRTFSPVYFESRGDVGLSVVSVDWFNSAIVYAGTSAGDLMKSSDGGAHWTVIKRFDDRIAQIYIDRFDSRILYVNLSNNGIWKTTDAGGNFTNVAEGLAELGGSGGFVTMTSDVVTRNMLLIATSYGILRSTDAGSTWQALNLPTPPGSVQIYSLAVNPRNGNEIFYGTASTYYKSSNGGANWTTKKLPTSRAATYMLTDPADGKTIYMGTTLFKK